MKRIFFFACCGLLMAACNQTDSKSTGNTAADTTQNTVTPGLDEFTTLQWVDSSFQDIGKVKEGQTIEVTYRFTNTGNKPLVVSNVAAGCGCTVADKPEEPIAPNAQGKITAKFNSQGQSIGEHRKEVYMDANTKPDARQVLSFRVEVIK